MQIQAIHSFNFCFGFHFFFNCGDLYYTQIALYISFVEIVFENSFFEFSKIFEL
jgi:hypothetical protein